MQTVTLNNGVEMPMLGYGVFQTPPEETARCVREALEITLNRAGITAEALGRRLLERAGIATSSSATATGKTSASPPT